MRRPRRKWAARAAVGLGATVAAMSSTLIAPALASASVTQSSHFVVNGSSASISGDTLFLNNGATNSAPSDLLFVSQNWNPTGVCGCIYNSAPVGVWYDTSAQQWGVFEENIQSMPAGASFNVLAVPASESTVFVQRSTASNVAGDFTLINSPLTNGKPTATLQVTQNWNPGGVGGAYNPHTVGVWYDASAGKWGIFNEDGATMPAGLSFNVLVGARTGATGHVQQATAATISGDTTFVNNAASNGDPNAVVLATPNWNPRGVGGTYDAASPGVWYDGSELGVFNEDGSSMVTNAAFNLLIWNS